MAEHEVDAVFRVHDQASGPLNRVLKSINTVSHSFDHASHILGSFASIAGVVGGAFGVERVVETAKEHFETVQRIGMVTGMAVEKTDALVESFAKVGIGGGEAERILLMMTRRGAQMAMMTQGIANNANHMGAQFKRMGIDIRKGPEQNLMMMAKRAQQGKLNVQDLMTTFGVRGKQAVDFMKLLERGPHALKEAQEEAKKFGITREDMAAYERVEAAQHAIKATWDRIMIIVGSKLMPVLADILESGTKQLQEWAKSAASFATSMGKFITSHGPMLMQIAKAMLLNFTLMKTTGGGFGHWAGKAAGFVMGGGANAPGAVQAASGIAGLISKIFGSRLIGIIGRFAIVGTVLAFAIKSFEMIKDNTLGIRDYLLDLWEKITARFESIKDSLSPIFDLFSGEGVVGKFFTVTVATVIETLGNMIDYIMEGIQNIINAFSIIWKDPKKIAHPFETMLEAAQMTEQQMRDVKIRRLAEEGFERGKLSKAAREPETPAHRAGAPIYDFRNSRFSIQQSFAEGFDPDRIAVAFSNDLATLGERKLQSAYGSPFGIR